MVREVGIIEIYVLAPAFCSRILSLRSESRSGPALADCACLNIVFDYLASIVR